MEYKIATLLEFPQQQCLIKHLNSPPLSQVNSHTMTIQVLLVQTFHVLMTALRNNYEIYRRVCGILLSLHRSSRRIALTVSLNREVLNILMYTKMMNLIIYLKLATLSLWEMYRMREEKEPKERRNTIL